MNTQENNKLIARFDGWAVKNPQGKLEPHTFKKFPSITHQRGWEVMKKQGYSCVRVKLIEIDEIIKQCCSCEKTFREPINNECPHCHSGNWVNGYIDDNQGGE